VSSDTPSDPKERTMIRPSLLLCSILASAAIAAEAPVKVSGQFAEWKFVDGIAVVDDGETTLVVSDRPFDRAGIAADLRFDIGDRAAQEQAGGMLLSIRIDAEGKMAGLGIGGSSSYTSEMDSALTLATRSPERLVGRYDDGSMQVDFDVPVWRNGALPRGGTPLAADGGEAGAALRAYLAAIAANDFDAFVGLSPPSWRESMKASQAKGEAQLEIDAVKSELPQSPRIVGGHGEAQRAWIDLAATRDGKPVKAVATVERDAGGWYVRRIETLR
jgi:hypothetical protein